MNPLDIISRVGKMLREDKVDAPLAMVQLEATRLKCPCCANVREPGRPVYCLHRHNVDEKNDWAIKYRMLPV